MIEGKKVRIRAIEKTDIDEIMGWVNDPQVKENLLMTGTRPFRSPG